MSDINPFYLNQRICDGQQSSWVWLLSSIFYWLPTVFFLHQFSLQAFIVSILLYLGFIACYFQVVNARGEKALLPILAILLIACFGTAATPGTMALFGYVTFFSGFCFSYYRALGGLVATLAAIAAAAYLFDQINAFFLAPSLMGSIALFFFGLYERKSRLHKFKEAKSQQQIEQLAALAERERIARDLHDLLGHTLSSIALKAELAAKLGRLGQTEPALREIDQVADITRETLTEVRQAVSGYKSRDFQTEITKLAERLKEQGFEVEVDVDLSGLTIKAESSLILILKEAVTNILRHSQGKSVSISARRSAHQLQLSVCDDGDSPHFNMGNGLMGIKERVNALGGTLAVSPTEGFSLDIKLPGEVLSS